MSIISKLTVPIDGVATSFDIDGNADWDASEGELGYVQNRTHYMLRNEYNWLGTGYNAQYNNDGILTINVGFDTAAAQATGAASVTAGLVVEYNINNIQYSTTLRYKYVIQGGQHNGQMMYTNDIGNIICYIPASNPTSCGIFLSDITGTASTEAQNVTLSFIGVKILGAVKQLNRSYMPYTQVAPNGEASTGQAFNLNNTAAGACSHAEGVYTKANGKYQHVQGVRNVTDTQNKYAHIVGGGVTLDADGNFSQINSTPKNIHTLDWKGNAVYAGDVTATDTDGTTVSLLSLKNGSNNADLEKLKSAIEINGIAYDEGAPQPQVYMSGAIDFTGKTVYSDDVPTFYGSTAPVSPTVSHFYMITVDRDLFATTYDSSTRITTFNNSIHIKSTSHNLDYDAPYLFTASMYPPMRHRNADGTFSNAITGVVSDVSSITEAGHFGTYLSTSGTYYYSNLTGVCIEPEPTEEGYENKSIIYLVDFMDSAITNPDLEITVTQKLSTEDLDTKVRIDHDNIEWKLDTEDKTSTYSIKTSDTGDLYLADENGNHTGLIYTNSLNSRNTGIYNSMGLASTTTGAPSGSNIITEDKVSITNIANLNIGDRVKGSTINKSFGDVHKYLNGSSAAISADYSLNNFPLYVAGLNHAEDYRSRITLLTPTLIGYHKAHSETANSNLVYDFYHVVTSIYCDPASNHTTYKVISLDENGNPNANESIAKQGEPLRFEDVFGYSPSSNIFEIGEGHSKLPLFNFVSMRQFVDNRIIPKGYDSGISSSQVKNANVIFPNIINGKYLVYDVTDHKVRYAIDGEWVGWFIKFIV